MLSEPTVIVLGAGASYEAGFPLGSELIEEIERYVKLVQSPKDSFNQQEIEFLQLTTQLGIKDVPRVIRTILKGLPYHDSIDNFLRAMEGDQEVVSLPLWQPWAAYLGE